MTKIFNLNTQEQQLIEELIQFIWEHKLIIKKGIFNFSDCFKKRLIKIFKYILPISYAVIKYTPVLSHEPYFIIPAVLMKLGLKYQLAVLVLAFLL
jgi:hypothetical protein